MDITKWKSVLVPIEVYEQIKTIAKSEGRTISGQLRYIFEGWKQENLSKNDQNYIAEQVESFKKESGSPINSKSFSI